MGDRTIFACSSGRGRSGIAVWRVSGPDVGDTLNRLVGGQPEARRASHRTLRDEDGRIIDDGIVLYFPGPKSVTGEDLAEFHTHGSEAVRARMAEVFTKIGLSAAKPGEFTMRAFENGRMDLIEVEALGDLLDAETEAQRQQAIAIGHGEASRLIEQWRLDLISVLALLEAAVDFPDEDDVPSNIANTALPLLSQVLKGMETHLDHGGGRKIREGLTLAVVGAPNAGKSSFLNKLLGEQRAIVSDIAGTTRDVVSERIALADRLVNVLDTAGIRSHTDDKIEAFGIEKAKQALKSANIVVWIRDASASGENLEVDIPIDAVRIDNKFDLVGAADRGGMPLSLQTGEGWQDVVNVLEQRAVELSLPSLFPHERQQALIRDGHRAVDRAIQTATGSAPPELVAEDVRSCLSALDRLEGRQTTEAVLGQIFSSFCIGK